MAEANRDHQQEDWLQAIWAAVPTPFLADQTLDLDGIAGNVTRFRALGLAGLFCNGLMGEGWSLSTAERCQILEAMVAAAHGSLRIGVVTTLGSIVETLELSRHAAASGADHIVLMRPAGLFSGDELADLVRMVCDAVACPVVLFDSEAQSGGYPSEVIRELAKVGRIHAVKCTRNGDAIAALRAECSENILICDPYESHALANLLRFGQPTLCRSRALSLPAPGNATDPRLLRGAPSCQFRGHARSASATGTTSSRLRVLDTNAAHARTTNQCSLEALVSSNGIGRRPRSPSASRADRKPSSGPRRRS